MTDTDRAEHVWYPHPVPAGLAVRQVYGWLLSADGRVLVQQTGQGANLPGGRPEAIDADQLATLRREALEESQVTVSEAVYLGFEQVLRDGVPVALVRMVGRIEQFFPRHPDPDGGRLLGRVLMPLADAPTELGWGRSGVEQAHAAALLAEARWGLTVNNPMQETSVIP